jgi:tRNA nucleotidyltransferase (CCA-adding enzyme)
VLEIARALEKAGHEVWCVGGAIRDALLDHPHLDWDFATSATPDEVRKVFGGRRTIPVGVEFGTVGVLDDDRVLHEVTTFRRDVRTDGRHAEVEFGASLEEDLARRDFTINAIAYSPTHNRLRDPFDGRADLAEGVVRAVGEPSQRMREDRLRALRAIRFAARFTFAIDPATWDAIRDSAPHLTRLSAERVKQEIEKTMDQVPEPSRAFALWRESGAFRVLLPELEHVTDTTLQAVNCVAQPAGSAGRKSGRRLMRLAVLLSETSPRTSLEVMTRLRFSKLETQWVAGLVERWRTLGDEIATALAAGEPDAASVRRWVAAIGRLELRAFLRMASAIWTAQRGIPTGGRVPTARAVHSLHRRSLRAAAREPVDLRDLAIDGDDLRQAGITPGPELGKILSALLAWVVDDPRRNTRDPLLAEARRLWDERRNR